MQNQESCVINGGTTTNYFKLERGMKILMALIFLKKHFYTQRM